ncbi:hypothetical protein ACFV1W_25495 [Kitasatospora sp. NPDC059648]|uniref:hypothetical protein n=1 Tax=Kitasatospora sp. NPDC059648 TaxID=3346894 RepID=UPI003690587D
MVTAPTVTSAFASSPPLIPAIAEETEETASEARASAEASADPAWLAAEASADPAPPAAEASAEPAEAAALSAEEAVLLALLPDDEQPTSTDVPTTAATRAPATRGCRRLAGGS